MKMLKNLKNKKGFTLIEIVIVIVIIAILAAMLVPSLLKWVDNANQKSFLEAANTIKTSTLSVVTDNYATGKAFAWSDVADLVGGVKLNGEGTGSKEYTVTMTPDLSAANASGNTVTTFVVSNNKYTATWTAGSNNWTVGEAGTTQAAG